MLREAVAMLVIGVTLALSCGVPLVQDVDACIRDATAVAFLYLAAGGLALAGIGAAVIWMEVLR